MLVPSIAEGIPVRYRELDEERLVKEPVVALVRGNHWLLWAPSTDATPSAMHGYWVRVTSGADSSSNVWKFLDLPVIAGAIESIEILSPHTARLRYADTVAELTLDDQGFILRATAPIRITIGLDVRPLGNHDLFGQPVTIFPRSVINAEAHTSTKLSASPDKTERYLIIAELAGQPVQAELIVRGTIQRASTSSPTARRWSDGVVRPLLVRETFTLYGTEFKFFLHGKRPVSAVTPPLSLKSERLRDFIAARLAAFRDGHFFAGVPISASHRFRDELMALWLLNHQSLRPFKFSKTKAVVLSRYLAALDQWSLVDQPDGEAAADTFPWLVLAVETMTPNEAQRLGQSFRQWLRLHLRDGEQLRVPLGRTWLPGRERPRPFELEALFLRTLERLAPSFGFEALRDSYRRRLRTHLITETYPAAELEQPTVFLAALIQPELLSSQKWEKLFDPILAARTTAWGGLVVTTDTGHHSWHWLNNIAALALDQINPKKYHDQIENFARASIDELLSSGALGWPGERSPAEALAPAGDLGSLLSTASLLRLVGGNL